MATESTPPTHPRLLCLMGSGELSTTMVGVHAELMARVGVPPGTAVMLDTSYGFQENADDLTAKAIHYFRTKVGQAMEPASFRGGGDRGGLRAERAYQALGHANYVFAGPGSPSYTIRHWRQSSIPRLIGARLAAGGCVTLASAAAMAIGRLALPVYEIYKAGEPPHWIDGLDLLSPLGLEFAVITHYDNTEGGTHDTRYCYMGARRLEALEAQLPRELSILGVDEHSAAIFDFDADTLQIRGRGSVVIRRGGVEHRFGPGRCVPLGRVRELVQQDPSTARRPQSPDKTMFEADSLLQKAQRLREQFVRALDGSAVDEALDAVLRLDEQLFTAGDGHQQGNGRDEARSIYRSMLLQLGDATRRGLASRQPLAQIVEVTLRLRDTARFDRRYWEADRLREALQQLGIDVQDTPDGTKWGADRETLKRDAGQDPRR